MEHADLIRHLVAETTYTARELRLLFHIFARIIREALVSGQDVQINGVGKIVNKLGKARRGRNPKTGEAIIIPAKRRLRFRTCTSLEMMMRKAGHNPLQEDPLRRFLKGNGNGKVRSSAEPPKGKNGSSRRPLPKVRPETYREQLEM